MPGFWLPHTSSIDFCEPDYVLTDYVAEPFNALSSFYIAVIGFVGFYYSNPTKEWPFSVLFMLTVFVGLGSVGLHTTLHWLPQSFDEIPMLWFDIWGIYALCRITDPKRNYRADYLVAVFVLITVTVTLIYYGMRSLYAAFIIMYGLATVIIVGWNGYIVWSKPRDDLILKFWATSIFFYACIAVVIWIIDMKMCDQLLPYYKQIYGCTAHVIWHVAAGMGAHIGVLQFVLIRARALKVPVQLGWKWGVPIVVSQSIGDKKK